MKNMQIKSMNKNCNKATGWQEINWRKVNGRIQDLQDKIVKATLKNNIKKVYRLQNKLVVSFEGRALAIRKVVTSSLCIDNIVWYTTAARSW